MTDWQDRIIGFDRKPAHQFLANPKNPREHPNSQREALRGSLETLGNYDVIIENQRTGHLIDGHARVEEALSLNENMPLAYILVDMSEEEEALALASHDYITTMANYARNSLDSLLHDVQTDDTRLQAMLSELAADNELFLDFDNKPLDGTVDNPASDVIHTTLAERFLIPPFSVLDARQGYWQERKRLWLSLGIESELGRGADIVPNGTHRSPENDGAYLSESKPHKINGKVAADSGGNPLPLDRMANGKSPARKFAQDLMKGEGNLTWVKGRNDSNELDETSRKILAAGRKSLNYSTRDWVISHELSGAAQNQSGTSIFDPVLCELAYTWFTPKGASILDPFSGGSVRGIVASYLGRSYTGVDLRAEQIEANIEQAAAILAPIETPLGDFVDVKISAKSARLLFNGCDPDYIKNVCHASCCQSSTSETGTMITIHPSEIATIEARGGMVKAGLLQPRAGEKKCPFKTTEHLCGLHFTPDKPFGCIASPFTLNHNNTLIVRNRYKSLKCYNDGKRIPAYKAFRASLDLIFGANESARICQHLEQGGGDIIARMPIRSYKMLIDNDDIKHGRNAEKPNPTWIVGDSQDIQSLASGAYDFIFTCPPYADLEIYSDNPQDISNMDYPQFLSAYRKIISESCAMLNDNRFACVVVGDIRDKKGNYRNFISDTIQAFLDSGLSLYNEAILVTSVGSLPIRAGKQFAASRKLGKTHQNVLVFLKGNAKLAAEYCGVVDVYLPDENELDNSTLEI